MISDQDKLVILDKANNTNTILTVLQRSLLDSNISKEGALDGITFCIKSLGCIKKIITRNYADTPNGNQVRRKSKRNLTNA